MSMANDEPLALAMEVTARPPSLDDNTADLDRLRRELGSLRERPLVVPFARSAKVASRFRGYRFAGKAVINRCGPVDCLVDFLPPDTPPLMGMALDLGTTHLEGELVELATGKVVARATAENRQGSFGADILSRIQAAARPDGQATLQQAAAESVNGLIDLLCKEAGTVPEAIRALAVAGNTTMIHLFLGLDPSNICREPYIPMAGRMDPFCASELGISLHPAAPVWCFPSVGSYFGGDLVAGIIATGIDLEDAPGMLIDVGTNAEVVVGCREWLMACAGAAGPALEGGVARMGMRAAPGAIERVRIDPESRRISWKTIGGLAPRGICGSGMIDLVAQLYLARMIDVRGKFRLDALGDRAIQTPEGPALVVATAEEGENGKPVLLTQVDLDALIRSKAAMYAILTTLASQVGIAFTELAKIFVAGAFGRHIDPRCAIVLGMIPDLPLDRYEAAGNTALAGARLALLNESARERAFQVTRRITYIELNVNQEFMIRFSGCRFIPHTDPSLFPSVPVFPGE